MTRQSRTWAGAAALAVATMACDLPLFRANTPPAAATLGQLYTAAAQTLAAAGTPSAGSTPTPTSTSAFPTLRPATPTSTSAPISRCDAATFVRDVTVPDGTIIDPGEDFVKTWRLLNNGSCRWTPAYSLVFVSGDRMQAALSIDMPGTVNPGQTVDLSAKMWAPIQNGEYQGYWRLRNAAGALFGIGAQAQGAFWVKIRVAGPTYTAYDFARNYCDAVWDNDSRDLPCPGREDDPKGYVIEIEDAVLESGNSQDFAGLLSVPKHEYNGSITGQYPPIKIHDGDHLQARVNCAHKAFSCNVTFSLYYRIGGGSTHSLGHWNEAYEGRYYPVDLDLSALAGSNVSFMLSVTTNGPFSQDYALWIGPRITRLGSRPSTRTPSPSATTTLTPTATPTLTSTATETPSPTPTP